MKRDAAGFVRDLPMAAPDAPTLAQLRGLHARLERELALARGNAPCRQALIERLAAQRDAIARAITELGRLPADDGL